MTTKHRFPLRYGLTTDWTQSVFADPEKKKWEIMQEFRFNPVLHADCGGVIGDCNDRNTGFRCRGCGQVGWLA